MREENKIKFEPSTLETIDSAMLSYIRELGIHTTTNKGFKETPVIWVGSERSHQIKEEFGIRDKNGILVLPQIIVKRTSVSKDLKKKGSFWSDIPASDAIKGGSIEISRRIQRKKTAEFANANSIRRKGKLNFQTKRKNKQTVYEILTIPVPSYVEINYEIVIRTDYQTQMNEVVQTFLTDTNGSNYFLIENNGHRYEAFYQPDISDEKNISNYDEAERIFRTIIPIRVLGYLITANKNEDKPYKSIRESAVSVAIKESFYEKEKTNLNLYNYAPQVTYNPSDLAGCRGFWLGEQITDASGSNMSNWVDDKGNILTTDAGQEPFSTIDNQGYQAARFKGNEYMEFNSVAPDLSDESFTIAVAYSDQHLLDTVVFSSLGNSATSNDYIAIQGYPQTLADPSTFSLRTVGRTTDASLILSDSITFPTASSYMILTVDSKKINLWADGRHFVEDLTYTDSFTFDQLTLGVLQRNTKNFYLVGSVRSFGVFDRKLSDTERRDLEQYYNDKYNYK